jgi:hypothetical protein
MTLAKKEKGINNKNGSVLLEMKITNWGSISLVIQSILPDLNIYTHTHSPKVDRENGWKKPALSGVPMSVQ